MAQTGKQLRFDGIGILILAVTAFLLVAISLAWGIRLPPSPDDTGTQVSMAWAAWAVVIVSVAGTFVGALSLLLIFATLREAKRSADAAEATVTVTRDIGMAQARAYVSVNRAKVRLYNDDDMAFVEFAVSNAGQSPALSPDFVVTLRISRFDSYREYILTATNVAAGPDLPAGQSADQTCLIQVDNAEALAEVRQLRTKTMLLLSVVFDVSYVDVFGVEQKSTSRYNRLTHPQEDLHNGLDLEAGAGTLRSERD